jgi:hypothetical protein
MRLRSALTISAIVAVLWASVWYQAHCLTAQSAFTGMRAVQYDYYGCDPATVQDKSTCQPRVQYTTTLFPGNARVVEIAELSNPDTSRFTQLFSKGRWTTVYPVAKGYYSVQDINTEPGHNTPDTTSTCSVTAGRGVFAGTATVLGYKAFKYVTTGPTQDQTVFLLPDFACFAARLEFIWKDPQSPAKSTYKIPASIVAGSFPESMLEPPADFSERSPLDIQHDVFVAKQAGKTAAEIEAAWQKRMAEPAAAQLQRFDAAWRRKHPNVN